MCVPGTPYDLYEVYIYIYCNICTWNTCCVMGNVMYFTYVPQSGLSWVFFRNIFANWRIIKIRAQYSKTRNLRCFRMYSKKDEIGMVEESTSQHALFFVPGNCRTVQRTAKLAKNNVEMIRKKKKKKKKEDIVSMRPFMEQFTALDW